MGGFTQQRFPDTQLCQLQAGLALMQLRLGDKSGALVTVAAIESDLEKADTLLHMGVNRMKAGKPTEALEMLLAASQAAQREMIPAPAARRGGRPLAGAGTGRRAIPPRVA